MPAYAGMSGVIRFHPSTTHQKVRSVCALLACVITNCSLLTLPTYIPPAASSAAACAVCGNRKIPEPAAQLGAATVVLAALAASVTPPTAFRAPLRQLIDRRDDLEGVFLLRREDEGAHGVRPLVARMGQRIELLAIEMKTENRRIVEPV